MTDDELLVDEPVDEPVDTPAVDQSAPVATEPRTMTPEEMDAYARAQGYVKPEPVKQQPVQPDDLFDLATKELGVDADPAAVFNRALNMAAEIGAERGFAKAMRTISPLIEPAAISDIKEHVRAEGGEEAVKHAVDLARRFGVQNLSNPEVVDFVTHYALGKATKGKSVNPPRRAGGETPTGDLPVFRNREDRDAAEEYEATFGKGTYAAAMKRVSKDLIRGGE